VALTARNCMDPTSLFRYQPVNPTTWVYLSSLLVIALYFKFSRLWSVRNLDLLGLIALSPGLLLVHVGRVSGGAQMQQVGYIGLFAIGGLFVIRLLVDSIMVRRPLLEPNLSPGGLTFLGLSLFAFLMATVLVVPAEWVEDKTPEMAEAAMIAEGKTVEPFVKEGPGNPLFHMLRPLFWNRPLVMHQEEAKTKKPADDKDTAVKAAEHKPEDNGSTKNYQLPVRIVVVTCHLLVLVGMILIGYRHFDNLRSGIAAAILYLIIPYTAQWTGQITHVLPAVLLVWAIVLYRQPLLSGGLIGISIGTFYYAMFLLPLWISFYIRRGWRRFLGGVLIGLAVMIGALAWKSGSPEEFWSGVRQTLGWHIPTAGGVEATAFFEGFWGSQYVDPVYRIPVLAAFVVVACSLALWPSQKNLGTLLSCSAVVMLGTQFWHAHFGGLKMAWYLPLLLLTIFRPNLEDRVALTVLRRSWFERRKATPATAPTEQAA